MRFVAVDWGTSTLRGALLGGQGGVLEEKSAPLGILNVPGGDFAAAFKSQFSEWMRPAGSLCLMSGMVGSRQGWQEAPYASCPAELSGLQRQLPSLRRGGVAISPGLDVCRDA